MKRKKRIETILKNKLPGWIIIVDDISILHKGHNNFTGLHETHFKITLKSNTNKKESQLATHRKINELLKNEFYSGLHALEIKIIS